MPLPLVRRVEILEEQVSTLSQLPERVAAVETQLVAVRTDFASLRTDMVTMRDELLSRIEAVDLALRAGDEETRRHMRVLHEDVISRIALLQEGLNWRNGPSGRPAHTSKPPKRRR